MSLLLVFITVLIIILVIATPAVVGASLIHHALNTTRNPEDNTLFC